MALRVKELVVQPEILFSSWGPYGGEKQRIDA